MQPDATSKKPPAPVVHRQNVAYDEYITWRAIGGMTVSETGAVGSITLNEFCQRFNVDRATTWRWSKEPGIEDKIKKRLDEIAPRSRVIAAWNRLLLIGLSSLGSTAPHHDQRAAVDALKTYLGHHGLRTPTQKQEIDASNNLMDLVNMARKKQIIEAEVVEGEVVDSNDHAGTSPSTD